METVKLGDRAGASAVSVIGALGARVVSIVSFLVDKMDWCAVFALIVGYGHQGQWWRRRRRRCGASGGGRDTRDNDGVWGGFVVE